MGRAKCCCGACAVDVEGSATLNGVCHCDNCRRRTGTAFGWSIYVNDGQVRAKSGPLLAYELPIEHPQTRWFCSQCGTTLFWKTASRPAETGIAGGCFEKLPPAPAVSVTDGRRTDWLSFAERVRCIG